MVFVYNNFRAENLDSILSAGVSEWQTRQTQNLLWATTCGFKSRCRHKEDRNDDFDPFFMLLWPYPLKTKWHRKNFCSFQFLYLLHFFFKPKEIIVLLRNVA